MKARHVLWVFLALLALFLILAPIGSYCLGREQDYREEGELRARPVHSALVASGAGPR